MRKFNISVNGTSYNVEVEEIGGFSAPVAAPVAMAAPAAAPAAAAPAAPAAPKAAPVASGTQVKSPMPGNILDVKVSVGDTVAEGDVLMILEAMKMENEILAPCDGKIVGVQVAKGASVNSGDVLAVLA
jgi:biotin carboxyl carrier protein